MVTKLSHVFEFPSNVSNLRDHYHVDLFIKLTPWFSSVYIKRFDGLKVGDIFEMEISFLFWKFPWQSIVVLHETDFKVDSFVVIGKKLPHFIKSWHHQQEWEQSGAGRSVISSRIEFECQDLLIDFALKLFLKFHLWHRQKVFKSIIKNPS